MAQEHINTLHCNGHLASAKQLLYSATCSFNTCAEQSNKDSVQRNMNY